MKQWSPLYVFLYSYWNDSYNIVFLNAALLIPNGIFLHHAMGQETCLSPDGQQQIGTGASRGPGHTPQMAYEHIIEIFSNRSWFIFQSNDPIRLHDIFKIMTSCDHPLLQKSIK